MGHVRILVAEDNAIIAEDLCLQLKALNYEILGVTDSGETAIQMAEVLRPDLVLMDVHLSGSLNGFEAGIRIQALLGCPILYVTSHPAARRMPYWVPKPFTPYSLASAITKALDA